MSFRSRISIQNLVSDRQVRAEPLETLILRRTGMDRNTLSIETRYPLGDNRDRADLSASACR
jgi:hypothetical protein